METNTENQPVVSSPAPQDPTQWGCRIEALTPLSADQALQRVVAGQPLEHCEIDELDLSGMVLDAPVHIAHCRIARLNLKGSVLQGDLTIHQTTISQQAQISDRNLKDQAHNTQFQGKVSFTESECLGEWCCNYATFAQDVVLLGSFTGDVLLNHCQMMHDLTLNQSVFRGKLEVVQSAIHGVGWFCQMQCGGDALFRRSTFHQKMNARQTHFQAGAYFTDVEFHLRSGFNIIQVDGQMEFDRAHFHGEFSSKGSHFKGRLSFHSSRADTRIHLHNSKFDQQVTFHRMQIEGPIRTPGVVFAGRVLMDQVRFHGAVDWKGTQFHGSVLCRNATLGHADIGVDLEDAVFTREVDFENTTFLHTLDCSRASFSGKTSFRKATIAGRDGIVSFENAEFKHRVSFERAHFGARSHWMHCVFAKRASLSRSTFAHLANFTDVSFQDKTYFVDANFAGKVFFHGSQFAEIDFSGAEFEGATYFSSERSEDPEQQPISSSFHGPAQFEGTRFLKKAMFQFVTFAENTSFKYAYFGEQISFRKSIFHKDALFTGIFCNLELDLRRLKVGQELTLKGANINRRVNLADAQFSGIRFYNLVTDLIAVSTEQVAGALRGDKRSDQGSEELERTAQEYLLLKKSFAYQGMHDEEDWAYWQFRRMSRVASSQKAAKDRNIWQLCKNGLERLFLDYGSSYGTHPLRITLLAFCLIIGFGVFYWCFPAQIILEGKEIAAGQKVTLVQSIYFSTMAFTTMGFGDVHPDFHGWLKAVVALEALVGIITMTLFVGTYARKIIR